MQNRMKTYSLTEEQRDNLLLRAQTGCLATLNPDGSPYVIPVHFVYQGGAIYIHGLPKGQKTDNIGADPRVSMAVYEMNGLLLDQEETPCDTNTLYQSVIVTGTAALVEDREQKEQALSGIVQKYTPQLADRTMPEAAIRGTAVIKIDIIAVTGKYYS